jgi:hypothetical protein
VRPAGKLSSTDLWALFALKDSLDAAQTPSEEAPTSSESEEAPTPSEEAPTSSESEEAPTSSGPPPQQGAEERSQIVAPLLDLVVRQQAEATTPTDTLIVALDQLAQTQMTPDTVLTALKQWEQLAQRAAALVEEPQRIPCPIRDWPCVNTDNVKRADVVQAVQAQYNIPETVFTLAGQEQRGFVGLALRAAEVRSNRDAPRIETEAGQRVNDPPRIQAEAGQRVNDPPRISAYSSRGRAARQ